MLIRFIIPGPDRRSPSERREEERLLWRWHHRGRLTIRDQYRLSALIAKAGYGPVED